MLLFMQSAKQAKAVQSARISTVFRIARAQNASHSIEIGTYSWLGLVFLRVFYADILVYLNISFHFSNSRHGCRERYTSDMDVRVHRCVRCPKTITKYLDKLIYRNQNSREYKARLTSVSKRPFPC